MNYSSFISKIVNMFKVILLLLKLLPPLFYTHINFKIKDVLRGQLRLGLHLTLSLWLLYLTIRSRKLNNEVKKRGGGFSKLCALSPQLQEFIGVTELARTEVVKQLWAYIREKDLQDPNNRRNIVCDERLRALFGVDTINMFQMNKALSKHIWPLDSDDGMHLLYYLSSMFLCCLHSFNHQ